MINLTIRRPGRRVEQQAGAINVAYQFQKTFVKHVSSHLRKKLVKIFIVVDAGDMPDLSIRGSCRKSIQQIGTANATYNFSDNLQKSNPGKQTMEHSIHTRKNCMLV